MRKKTLNFILLFLAALFVFSCNDNQDSGDTKDDVATFRSCVTDCNNKERACWDEYDRCKGQAAGEEQTALGICSRAPEADRLKCNSDAITTYRNKLEECEKKLRACLEEVRKCRDSCGTQLTKNPDTQKK